MAAVASTGGVLAATSIESPAQLAAPAAGAVIGLIAGLCPALRASAVEPAEALR